MSSIDYQTAVSYNGRQLDDGDFTREMIARLVQEWQENYNLAVDGMCGPRTQASILSEMPPPEPEPREWKAWDGPLEKQPSSRKEIYAMFGTPGKPGSAWAQQHIVESRGANAFPGVPGKWYVQTHADIEPYAREGLRRAHVSSSYVIERCGGYVYRHVQYNEEYLSYHSWGIALDLDSNRNFAKRYKRGTAPNPWSPEWMKVWPTGIDEPFVRAMESCGWSWGGFWQTFVDPMHFEWVGKHDV